MRSIKWITGVAILGGAVFFLSDFRGYMWTSLVLTMSVVGLFFIGLTIYLFKNTSSVGDRMLGLGVLVLLTGFAVYSGISNYQHSQWHHKLMTEQIRTTIDHGIITSYMKGPLLKTLKARYRENTETNNVKQLFMQRYRDQLKPSGNLTRFVPEEQNGEHYDDYPFMFYDSTHNEDRVVLIGQSGFGNGEDPEFNNYDGSKGNLQYKAVLTAKGVDYVKEN